MEKRRMSTVAHRCLGAAVISAGVGFCVFAVRYGFPGRIQARLDILPDRNAQSGTLHAGEMMEVADGDFWVVMNQLPTMETGSLDCNIEYENPSSNRCAARVSLYLQETGNLLGSTGRVDPGNYVETIRLKQELPPGEYPVTVKLELFEEKTPAGTISIDITLRIVGEHQNANDRQGGDAG